MRRNLNKKSKLEPSRGVVFTTAKSDSARYCSTDSSSVAVVKTTTGSGFLGFDFLFKFLLCILPLCLFFSYHPVIGLGGNESMNFELSLPLIWLVLFDIVAVVLLARRRELFKWVRHGWMWVLLPLWLSLSIVWSLNVTRGVLTAGIMWLIFVAGYGMWTLRDLLNARYKEKWWKWLIGSTLFVCGWCVLQCILDLVGVSRECSLMCEGCTYHMFGFPHPNGFAIEPQFMGNLLLAPILALIYLLIAKTNMPRVFSSVTRGEKLSALRKKSSNNSGDNFSPVALRLYSSKTLGILVFIMITVLFLTFSRGAIYAFVVGMVVMSVVMVVREKKSRSKVAKRVGIVWGIMVVAFVVALNVQGLMAQVSRTDDTYVTGVTKVLNHLSLGVIDVRGDASDAKEQEVSGEVEEGDLVVENSVENLVDKDEEKSAFDGYVAESTDTRLRLTGAALEVWSKDFKTAMVGVGIGGAGFALYNNGLSPAPKEIVQNEYASLLLESGIVGVLLTGILLVLVIRMVWRNGNVMVMALLVAYGVTLFFFSGLPNALQIYLMPVVLMVMCSRVKKQRFKQ